MQLSEQVAFDLRSLYSRYGYTQYKMSKFEEYDLYARNKDFLISDRVITFMDVGGRLMALKPDVTLSIVKNTRDCLPGVQKLYYHENVYRVTPGAHGFREIMQLGLECLGAIDDWCQWEVLNLAAESLRSISDRGVLDISHLGLLEQLLERGGAKPVIGSANRNVMTTLWEGEGQRCLFVMNLYASPQKTDITLWPGSDRELALGEFRLAPMEVKTVKI